MNTIDISNFIRNIAIEHEFSGVILLSQQENELYKEAFGFASRDWNILNNIDTRFNTASISKIFTACGILKLAEQGLIRLDDRIDKYLKIEGSNFSKDITIYHLLTHSSGIADDADEEAGEKYEEIFIDKPNYRFRKASDLVENFIGKSPVFEPGKGCRYNNAAYVLLGIIVENVTGTEYKQWLKDNVLIPWGLKFTYFPSMDEINHNTAEGYFLTRNGQDSVWKKNIYSIPPIGTPEGGIYSTADDLNRLLNGLVKGEFFSPEYTSLMLSPKEFHSENKRFKHMMGFGFEFNLAGERIVNFEKDGCNPGVSAAMAYYPASQTSIIILSNIDCNVWKMHRRIDKYLDLSE